MVNSLGWDRLRSRTPPDHMELWVRKLENKRSALKVTCWFSFPQECLDDRAATAYISQWVVVWMGRNSRHSLRLVWPGRVRQGYSSLGVLDQTSSEVEACHSSKIV